MEYAVAALLTVCHGFAVRFAYEKVPEPYMDEIFHVNQTRAYCSGDFFFWNEKITTPPALYYLAMTFFCGVERYTNTLLVPVAFLVVHRLRLQLFPKSFAVADTLAILSVPVLLHSSLLFYTDLLSLAAVLAGVSFGIDQRYLLSSLFFGFSVLTRQTNIVWAFMFGVHSLLGGYRRSHPIGSLLGTAARLWSLVLLGIGFAFFVFTNKGIVLGDRSAHEPKLHLVQVLYASVFVAFSSAPHFLSHFPGLLRHLLSHPFRQLLFLIPIFLAIHFTTMDHPYLLADNRHIAFYVWQRFFRRHELLKYVYAPVYLCCVTYALKSVRTVPRLVVLLATIASCVVLVPAHLLEPRYFIIPYAVWRLGVKTAHLWTIVLETFFNVVVALTVLYLFYFRPFEWHNEPGVQQRFMW
uniref:Dol-P-Glc:Glc(2)Man(9)GlcNAc(2)-PP-Dol alpha-1,2-glucosyltransferase n=1 Tax=Steinernema glaseri TaxID=37863 RepID=A0A1I8A4T7_9BILA